MILIVGLGNPGEKYRNARHNIGSRIIDNLSLLNGKEVILVKPKTFMNLSGKAAKVLVQKYKIPTTNLWVIHDDIDLPLGKIKIVKNRGAAGHKGVESIIKELKTKNFIRFRIGIGPENPSTRAELGAGLVPHRNKVSGAGFVLQRFNKEEEKILKKVIGRTCQAMEMAVKDGVEKAMQEYNRIKDGFVKR